MTHDPPQGCAKPRGTPNPAGCQRCCYLWNWTRPCPPCLKTNRKGSIESRQFHSRGRNIFFFFTLSSYNQTRHAVWNTGPSCQEGYSHDVVWDVQCVADDGDLEHEETSGSLVCLYTSLFHWAQWWDQQPPDALVRYVVWRSLRPPPYHPHHEVGKDCDPQGGSHKSNHEPAVPPWQDAVGHRAVKQQSQWPRDHPLHPRTEATCTQQKCNLLQTKSADSFKIKFI